MEFLLKTLFAEKDDYQEEKFIKTFCEHLTYLEEVLCYERGIHPNQMPSNSPVIARNKDEYMRKVEEVKNRMESQIERLSGHFTVFM